MTITEENMDLFNAPQGMYLTHCISDDYTLGAGIAKQFDQIYNMRYKLHQFYPRPNGGCNVGRALLVDNVFNLVTKEKYFHKPTYESLVDALMNMKEQCIDKYIHKLAIPKIGCGLDKLQWPVVKTLIENIFDDTDIDILVCVI